MSTAAWTTTVNGRLDGQINGRSNEDVNGRSLPLVNDKRRLTDARQRRMTAR